MLGNDYTHRVKHLVPPHWEHRQAARTLVQIVQSNKLPRWCKQWEVPLCQTSLFCTYNLTYSVSFQPRGKQCELCSRQPCKLVETTPWWLDENANLVLLSILSQQTQVLMLGPRCSLSQSFYIGRLYYPCSPNHSTHDSFQPVPIFIKRCQNLCCFCIDMALADR